MEGLSNGENGGGPNYPEDPLNPKADQGLSSFDSAYNFRTNAIYRFPTTSKGGILGKLVNGWGMNGILSW